MQTVLFPFIFPTEVSDSILEVFDQAYPDKGKQIFADFKSTILVIGTTRLAPNETLERIFDVQFTIKIQQMDLGRQLVSPGATRITYSNFVKEPDASWKLPKTTYPSLVLETGLSEKRKYG